MNRRHFFLLAGVFAVGASGCTGFRCPRLHHPGTVEQQRKEAERFDPYPENDIGPPVVGARPREYEAPAPEPERARRFSPFGWQR